MAGEKPPLLVVLARVLMMRRTRRWFGDGRREVICQQSYTWLEISLSLANDGPDWVLN